MSWVLLHLDRDRVSNEMKIPEPWELSFIPHFYQRVVDLPVTLYRSIITIVDPTRVGKPHVILPYHEDLSLYSSISHRPCG